MILHAEDTLRVKGAEALMRSLGQAAWTAITIAMLSAAAATAWPAWQWQDARDILGSDKTTQAQAVISAWPTYSSLAALAMMEEYGPPDELDDIHLAWSSNGPWLRIVVYKTATWPYTSEDILEQSVGYEVPQERWPALAGFGHGLAYDARSSELTSRSSSEEMNFLALNLADDIAKGKMSPEAADRLYAQITAESMAGRSSRYMRGLLFATRRNPPALDWRRDRRW
jgi:hypothetical protein